MSINQALAVSDDDDPPAEPTVPARRSRQAGHVRVAASGGWAHEESATDLYRRVARGDQQAFSDLYDLIAPAVLGMLTGNRTAQPEAVLLSVFLHLWKIAPTLAVQDKPMAEMLDIAFGQVRPSIR
ncbi:sigma-70 family RNA polymerase sigma factor [Subtercola endophyticus]|uniref:hypothetical protein n=1 Tax=Subtercola endophyticus TaxID=2895559 RepID=UPI001E4F3BFF|nr:hypothetical protein [Subtercola endophyticus]UFS60912.1 hypothetical protein LQ955_09345 [Subtercola endophyticus]